MTTKQAYRPGRRVVHALQVHLVFVTKYRRHVLDAAAHEALRPLFAKVAADFGATLLEANGEDDHVHLLVAYPPAVAVSALVNSLKGVSSRLLGKSRPDLVQRYYREVLWSPSYVAASCGGAPLTVIRQYIERQRTPV